MVSRALCLVFVALSSLHGGSTTRVAKASPSARLKEVLELLHSMREKVLAEGKHQAELYDKFRCHCETNMASLGSNIETASRLTQPIRSEMSELDGQSGSLQAELEQHARDEKSLLEGMQEARQIRQRASDGNKARAKELSQHMGMMDDAIRRIQAGGTGFLQEELQQLQQLQQVQERLALTGESLDKTTSFSRDPGAALGTLQKLRGDIEEDYRGALQSEKASAAEFRDLEVSKLKERRSLQQQMQRKGSHLSDLKLRLVQLRKSLEQTDKQLSEDQQSLRDLKESCRHKSEEWQTTEASRSDELAAIAEALMLLSDGSDGSDGPRALKLLDVGPPRSEKFFEEPLGAGGPLGFSLLQLQKLSGRKALSALSGLGTEFIWLAMRGSQSGLDKVVARIDQRVANLAKEEASEEQKKLYCQAQYDSVVRQAAELSSKREDAESLLRSLHGRQVVIQQELKEEMDSLQVLEESQREAERLRDEERAELKKRKADAVEAKDVLEKVVMRLSAAYANPKRQSLLDKVILLLHRLMKDLDDERDQAETAEEKGQLDHQNFLKDASERRSGQMALLISKRAEKASLEEELRDFKERRAMQHSEEEAHKEYKASLDGECDWLVNNWDARVAARERDVQALKDAKSSIQRAQESSRLGSLRGSGASL